MEGGCARKGEGRGGGQSARFILCLTPFQTTAMEKEEEEKLLSSKEEVPRSSSSSLLCSVYLLTQFWP